MLLCDEVRLPTGLRYPLTNIFKVPPLMHQYWKDSACAMYMF